MYGSISLVFSLDSVFQNEDMISISMIFKYLETQSHRGHERGSTVFEGNLSLNEGF